ncbi:adenosine 3'-phospho 5'-phosphosulfate transporter 1-like [Centruroides sculpturatus]|uniref:adenosine 3'-phospho 5'-phosphosulfate transporter 1-like n=1 Tax=Centruroides sculpturatus TaxID=218467 RepID=UPI000C6EF7E7|nr:adenosine 3'-phospho 5'-phosphosulfate transporter 1-like [Centruroides sculpturatus]XP_023244834.1 adenosine 3'-phospho 5'-phosphosulfate transporter 1-like [Centruroides sculpturatus]
MRVLFVYICIVHFVFVCGHPLGNISTTFVDNWSSYWFLRLMVNILGYATVLVPGAIIIFMIKRSNYLDRKDKSCIQKCLQLCIYGTPEDRSSTENVQTKLTFSNGEKSTYQEAFQLLFCFFGLQISYLTWGVLQEKIMTQKYKDVLGETQIFTDSQFLVFVNRVLAFIFSGVYILISKQPHHVAPLYKYSYCSFSNIMSSWCQYEALKFVSFPIQILAKASKIIPVMLMGKVVSKKTYSLHEYASAVMISVGMVLFLLSQGEQLDRGTVTSFSGFVILVGYMLFDSFTSNWQGKLFNQYHMSSVQMMCGVNLFSCIFTSVSLLQQGAFYRSVSFMFQFSQFFMDCVLLSICSAMGQLFIFYTISQFGPVAFVIMMTVRQAIAILLSCLIYQHPLNIEGGIGITIVFSATFFKVYYNRKIKLAKQAQKMKKDLLNGQAV